MPVSRWPDCCRIETNIFTTLLNLPISTLRKILISSETLNFKSLFNISAYILTRISICYFQNALHFFTKRGVYVNKLVVHRKHVSHILNCYNFFPDIFSCIMSYVTKRVFLHCFEGFSYAMTCLKKT